MKVADMDEDTKIGIWCIGALNGLVDLKMLPKGACNGLTPQGVGLFDQIDSEFKPADKDILEFLESANIKANDIAIPEIRAIDLIFSCLIDFRDRRTEMRKEITG